VIGATFIYLQHDLDILKQNILLRIVTRKKSSETTLLCFYSSLWNHVLSKKLDRITASHPSSHITTTPTMAPPTRPRSRSQTSYFGAGPAPLPTPVLEAASSALLNYNNLGLGITEMSHRSPEATAILSAAKAAMSSLLDIPEDYEILFLQGGGSGQFSAVVYHLVGIWVEQQRLAIEQQGEGDEHAKLEALRKVVKESLKLEYLVTGSWSLKASQEAARLVGPEYVHIVTDARKANSGKFGVIPEPSSWGFSGGQKSNDTTAPAPAPALTYFCDNETVDGVEFPSFPTSLTTDTRTLIADMSSNFLSRRIPISRYSVIFAGAQKNLGIPGVTIVIIRKSLLGPSASSTLLRSLNLPVGPIVLDYSTAAKNNSLYNTLPIFDVWVAGQVLEGLVKTHGERKIEGQEEVAGEKARVIYEMLDKHSEVYRVVPDRTVRSRMNICVRIKGGDEAAEKAFIAGAEEKGLLGLKGHRSVGGIRISNCECARTQLLRSTLC